MFRVCCCSADLAAAAKLIPWVDGKRALDDKPTAFVCERGACKFPTSDPAVLTRQLRDVQPLPLAPAP